MPPRQLLAGAEIKLSNNVRIDGLSDDSPSLPVLEHKSNQNEIIHHKWTRGTFENVETNFITPDYSKFVDFSPLQMFELFWTNDIFEYLLTESTKYASFKNNQDPKFTIEELKCAIGIFILSGYNEKPGKRFY